VQLTQRAITELDATVKENQLAAQQNNARGYQAQRQGNEVTAQFYYVQAAQIDPTLFEAVNRSNVMFTSVSTGNIGADARNDARARDAWERRLKEVEELAYDLLSKTDPPYTLFYATNIRQEGNTNYQNRTMNLRFSANMRANPQFFSTAIKALETVVQTNYDGLIATGRASTWGFSNWPNTGLTRNNPFGKQWNYPLTITFELLNAQSKVIGSKEQDMSRSFTISRSSNNKIWTNFNYDRFENILVSGVKIDDYTDERTTIRISRVNRNSSQNAKISFKPLTESVFNRNREQSGQLRIENGWLRGFNSSMRIENNKTYSLVIPDRMWDEPIENIISAIEAGAFKGKRLSSVTIPNGIKEIPREAFAENLITSVTIPNSVSRIGNSAFALNRLESVTLPSSVTQIGSNAFNQAIRKSRQVYDSGSRKYVTQYYYEGKVLSRITIGRNVEMADNSFDWAFPNFYNNIAKKNAGTYTYTHSSSAWNSGTWNSDSGEASRNIATYRQSEKNRHISNLHDSSTGISFMGGTYPETSTSYFGVTGELRVSIFQFDLGGALGGGGLNGNFSIMEGGKLHEYKPDGYYLWFFSGALGTFITDNAYISAGGGLIYPSISFAGDYKKINSQGKEETATKTKQVGTVPFIKGEYIYHLLLSQPDDVKTAIDTKGLFIKLGYRHEFYPAKAYNEDFLGPDKEDQWVSGSQKPIGTIYLGIGYFIGLGN